MVVQTPRQVYESHHLAATQNENYVSQTPSTSRDIPQRRDAPPDSHNLNQNDIANHNVQPEKRDEHNQRSQLPNDLKYNVTNVMERCSISRARSNDHLLETSNAKGLSQARKEVPMKQKSKSFESLGNDVNEDEVS